MVLTVSFVISPVIGLSCHRRFALAAKLDASVEASGPHDFAVRVSTVRQRCLRVHRIPCPTSVTIAIRPSCGTGWRAYSFDLGEAGTVLFLQIGLDSPNQLDPVEEIRPCAFAFSFFSVVAGFAPPIHVLLLSRQERGCPG